MFRIFKKQKHSSALYPLWQRLNDRINAKARRWADWLNAKAQKISRRNLMYLLVVFCLYWGAASMYIILRSVQKRTKPFAVTAVSVPKHIAPVVTVAQDTSLQNAVKRIGHFKTWLDSLRKAGDPRYQNILKERPGLLDSIEVIEQYYSFKK